jgi:hypothetical protein
MGSSNAILGATFTDINLFSSCGFEFIRGQRRKAGRGIDGMDGIGRGAGDAVDGGVAL